MARRSAISLKLKLDSLLLRRMVVCILCRETITSWEECEWHHIHERELGGRDSPDNVGPVHREPCHQRATARFARDRAHIIRLRKKAAGKWPRGAKIYSRGFDRTKTRHLDGSVADRRVRFE